MKKTTSNPATNETKTMTNSIDINAAYSRLAKLCKSDLKAICKRSHRIVDLRQVSKDEVIVMILVAEHGRKRCAAAFGWDK